MDYLPLFSHLANKSLCPELQPLADNQTLRWIKEPFAPGHMDEMWLVIAATNRREVNRQVFEEATRRRLFCNVVDDPELSSFVMPSIVDRSPLLVAISSAGPNLPVAGVSGSKPVCRPALGAAFGSGCSEPIDLVRHWRVVTKPPPHASPSSCWMSKPPPALGRWCWLVPALAIRVCSPCTPCVICSKPTW